MGLDKLVSAYTNNSTPALGLTVSLSASGFWLPRLAGQADPSAAGGVSFTLKISFLYIITGWADGILFSQLHHALNVS